MKDDTQAPEKFNQCKAKKRAYERKKTKEIAERDRQIDRERERERERERKSQREKERDSKFFLNQ